MPNIKKHIENGVIFMDEKTAFIEDGVVIGKDTVIEPCVYIKGSTVIGSGARIGFCSEIVNSVIGDKVTVTHSVITESTIGEGTAVGPFAYIRPGCHIGKNIKIGDFVEIKNSEIGDDTKISHLTYVGDALVGKNVNFGCGTVVVNYDGKVKNKTIVEDNAFVGCNTNLVAPVTVGKNAFTAAGSTITGDVPENSLAIARAYQTIKKDWVLKRK
jgi:bifunctional UDP-N-acetylglucosamine pyrophosphorylase/glucosamine-1-phosphate N-acetyltransferase